VHRSVHRRGSAAHLAFRETYNTTWLIERHGFQTPAAVRQNQLSPAAAPLQP